MKELIITPAQEGQKLERVLQRCLQNAPSSFLYKMLRKKNITLNGKKAAGKELLTAGDAVQIWFSEETFAKFSGDAFYTGRETPDRRTQTGKEGTLSGQFARWILYEDEHIVLVNKPAGLLTQKASPGDVSLNEYAVDYLLSTGQTDRQKLVFVRPSACNRLDRNTSGIVTIGKTQQGLRLLTALFRERTVHKDYQCIVLGQVEEEQIVEGFLSKDPAANKVHLSAESGEGAKAARTRVRPLCACRMENGMRLSVLEIRLFTGRTHQIRAHLAGIGHPIIGDEKYGDHTANAFFREHCGVRSQLLHACSLEFPAEVPGPEEGLSGRRFTAQPPGTFTRVLSFTKNAPRGCEQQRGNDG